MFSMKTNKILPSLFAFVAMLALPSVALALDMEYYVYGGFRETVSAFNKVALIYSDNQYKTITAAVFIAMLAYGLFKANIHALSKFGPWLENDQISYVGGRVTVMGVLVNTLISIALYVGLVLPTATLHIYDAEDNQYQAVGSVPQLVVLAAGGTNLIERSFVEIIETAGDPLSFSKQAGMKGIHFMNSLMPAAGRAPKGDAGLVPTTNAYIQDCVFFGVSQGNPTADEIMSGGTLLATTFSNAAVAGNLTKIYNNTTPEGAPATCSDAWANIAARFDAAFVASSAGTKGGFYWTIADACKDAGYDVFQADPTKADLTFNSCTANMNAFITTIAGGWDLNKFVKEMFLVNLFWGVQAVDNPDLLADRAIYTQYTSAFTQFMQGIGTKRGVMIAMVTAMLPFALIMMVGGQWGKMLNLTVGAYMFPTVWGILMAVATDFFLSAAVANWSSLLASWGVSTADVLQSDMAKRMMWWSVYLTATFGLTSMLVSRMGFFAGGAGHMAGAQGAAAEGDLSRGRLGTGTREAASVATAEGAATKYAGYTREMGGVPAMENTGGSWSRHEMLTKMGVSDHNAGLLDKGLTYNAAFAATTNSSGLREADKLKAIMGQAGGADMIEAARMQAGATGTSYTLRGEDGQLQVADLKFGAGGDGGQQPFNLETKQGLSTTGYGTAYTVTATTSSAAPGQSLKTVEAAGAGKGTLVESKGSWTEDKVNAVAEGLRNLSPNATEADYKAFAQQHGMSAEAVKSMHQNYTALTSREGANIAEADKGLRSAIKSSGGPVKTDVAGVQLQDVRMDGTVGTRKGRSEVAATEIAQAIDVGRLRSEGAKYLQSIGFTKTQSKSIVESWKKSTGEELGVTTADKEIHTQTSTHTNAVTGKVGLSTPSLPGKMFSAGVEISTNHQKGSQDTNATEKTVAGKATESESRGTDKQLANMVARTAATSKSRELAENLSTSLKLSEAAKAAISDTREDSVSGATSTNLATYAVQDLMSTRFNTGNKEADMADAMKWLKSDEAAGYREEIAQRFAAEHVIGQKVDGSVDKAQEATGIVEKHEKGIDPDLASELQQEKADLDERVPAATKGAPEYHLPQEKPSGTPSGSGRRPAKTTPVPETSAAQGSVAAKIAALNAKVNTEKDKFTSIPLLNSTPAAPGELAGKVGAHGSNLVQEPQTRATRETPRIKLEGI